jgi:DNA-binding beta-propeller fold protein YncE
MMTRVSCRLVLLLAALIFPGSRSSAIAEPLYGLAQVGFQQTLYTIDTGTGALTPLFATGVPNAAIGASALDAAGKRFFFSSPSTSILYSVDIAHAVVTPLRPFMHSLEFDPLTQTLYGMDQVGSEQVLFAIDPATGTRTQVVGTGVLSTAAGTSAYDPVTKRYFFASFTNLYVVDVTAMSVTQLPTYAFNIEFDPLTHQLYGLDYSMGQVKIFSIDPVTGTKTLVMPTGIVNVAAGVSAFDSLHRRFFFAPFGPPPLLAVADLTSQTVTQFPTFAAPIELDPTPVIVPTASTTVLLLMALAFSLLAVHRLGALAG